MNVLSLCAINSNPNDYIKWINCFDSISNISFTHNLAKNFSCEMYDAPKNVTITSFENNIFWATAIREIAKKQNFLEYDFILIFNHDAEPNLNGIANFFSALKPEHSIGIGKIANQDNETIIFGPLSKKGTYKFSILESDINKLVCAHGNFLLLNSNSVLDINAWPAYTHAYLDFHLSHHIVLQKKPVFISHKPVGFTSEDAMFRQQKRKNFTGFFSPGRSNIFDKYIFYNFYLSKFYSVMICLFSILKPRNLYKQFFIYRRK